MFHVEEVVDLNIVFFFCGGTPQEARLFQVFHAMQIVFIAIEYVAIHGPWAAAVRRRVGMKLSTKV